MAEDGVSNMEGFSSATGLVYDEKLTRHYCAWNPAYTERPERLQECYSRIQQLGLVERCVNVPVRPATDEEVGLCHTKKHMDLLRETQYMTTEQLSTLSRSYDFVYFHKTVEENARLALGASIDLVDQVLSGQLQNGMAFIRPPGHHAMTEQFCGYCYFNNIAVVARTALQKHHLKRILIVDWDVHHGQGTQFDFYNDPRVLYFSIHRYEHGEEWPHLRESDFDYTGKGEGKGFNINVALNERGCDNSDYLSIFFNVLLPVAYEFQPELVLVSAGYDSAIGCPEGEMSVTPACFAHFVQLLKPLAAGKLVLLLEGGYCLRTLAEGAALSLRALLGDPTPNIDPLTQPKKSVVESILNTVQVHQAEHPCLAFQSMTKEGGNQVFPWQSSAPQVDVELRTRDRQPPKFPLIQQCYDSVSEATRAAINKKIEQLEKDTVLTSTKYRIGIGHYPLAGPMNSRNRSVEEVLLQRGLLSSCFKLPSGSSSLKSTVSAAVAAIVDNTVQAFVMIPGSQTAEGESGGEYDNLVKTAADCLQSDFHVKRTLYLSLSSRRQPPLQSLMPAENNRSLVISLGPCSTSAEPFACGQPAPVSVPLTQSQLHDADIIAAIQQIVLPIAYEFGPDFVVVCLDSLNHNLSGDQIVSSIGHVMTVAQSLARGRLLLLVSPEAVQEVKETVVECVSALQGRPCQLLSVCIPQSSTVEVIKGVQDREKAVWNMLQFREKLPPPPR